MSAAPNESPFLAVNFHLIKPCNENCKYCFATFRDVSGRLSHEQAEQLVRLLISRGTDKLTFVGGEPTMHKALPRLLRVAHDAGVTTMVVSNGFRLRAVLAEAGDAIDWVGLSLDSAREDTQQALGRGEGAYVRLTTELFEEVRSRGLRTKLNTVVTRLNWEEDMSQLVRRLRPDRWKAFQVLPIDGQNNGSVEPLLISAEEFTAFLDRHASLAAEGLAPVGEDNEAMTGSYLMIDPLGRFFDNVAGRLTYSRPILEVGPEAALQEIRFSLVRLESRGGRYSWNR